MAVATPCWPAPVSATRRCLPMRSASSAWPSTLLILWLPVWLRSSRFSSTRQPELGAEALALGEDRRPAGVVAQQVVELGRGRRGRPTPRGTRPRAPRRPGTSVSGTNRPPNRPKRPSGPGSPITRSSVTAIRPQRFARAATGGRNLLPPSRRGRGRRRRCSPGRSAARALRTKSRTLPGPCGPVTPRRRSTRRRPTAGPARWRRPRSSGSGRRRG